MMSKKRSGNSRISYHMKNPGYFMEDSFNQSESILMKNDSLELNVQHSQKFYLRPQASNLMKNNNSTFHNTSCRMKQNSYLSPRLMTASTTTQRSSFNISNVNHSNSNSQTLGISHAIQNSYQAKNRSLKMSLHEKGLKQASNSVYNAMENIFLSDISTNINQSDIYHKKEKSSQFLNGINSQRSERIVKSKDNSRNIIITAQDDISSDIIIETQHQNYQSINNKNKSPSKNDINLKDPLLNDETKILTQESDNNKLPKPHNMLLNNYSQPKKPILNKIFSSQANLKSKSNNLQQRSQNLPITSRLQLLVNNKVVQRFLDNTQENEKSTEESSQLIESKSQRDMSVNQKEEKQINTEISISSPLDSKRKIQQEQKKTSIFYYQIFQEKENIFTNINYSFQYFLNEYKRVSNMYKLSSTYRQGISNLYLSHANCTNKLLSHIDAWKEIKKNKNTTENKKIPNIVEQTADSLAIDVFQSKNPMQIMSVSLACAKIYINLKKPIKAIPILKQCKRLSDLFRNQSYKMKCYRALSECFIMIRKEAVAEKFVKKYLQLSWCNKSDKNELQAYDMLGLISYYNGDIERAKFYHHRMANNILEDEDSQLRKISILNQFTKQKRRDEKMKDENPPITKKVEGDDNMFIDSSDEENEEILLVPEPNQQNQIDDENVKNCYRNQRFFKERYSGSSEQSSKQLNQQASPQLYLTSKQGFDLRKQPFKAQLDVHSSARIISEANQRIRQPKKIFKLITYDKIPAPVNNQKTDFGPLKPPILISHLSRNRALLNFQKFELQNKIDSSSQMDINYWEPYDLKKAENILLRLWKVLSYFKHILNDFSLDMNANILFTEERNKYFSDKQFSIKHYLFKLISKESQQKLKTIRLIKQ